ncbi:MAG: helix-turn-helix domain-containing protein [Anaerovibrio sp.]|nr:helix-turn-helix domain-containing protein [Anaerovibrio sp.]
MGQDSNPIKEAREKAGLSIKELSDLLGAPYRTVQEWNAGRSKPVDWAERLIIEKLERMTADK